MPEALTDTHTISAADTVLLERVRGCINTLADVATHADVLHDATIHRAEDARADVLRRLDRRELFVCIVGENKSGKSTFLNAILGERILGAANREYTGAVTTVRRADRYTCVAHLTDGTTEDFSTLAPDRSEEMQAAINACEARVRELSARKSEGLAALNAAAAERDRIKGKIDAVHAAHLSALGAFNEARAAADEVNASALAAQEKARQSVPDIFCVPVLQLSRFLALIRRLFLPFFRGAIARMKSAEDARNQAALKALEVPVNSEAFKKLTVLKSERLKLKREAEENEQLRQTRQRELEEIDAQIDRANAQLESERAAFEQCAYERKAFFIDTVARMTDMERDAGRVAELAIEFPAKYLPDGVVFIDTPGVNTDVAENRARAWNAIHRDADGCILLSDLQQAVSQSTKDFIDEIKKEVPHIVLVLTKVDKVLSNAEGVGDDPPDVQVDDARRKGVIEFAKKVKRAPEELLAVALAAKPVLDHPGDAAARGLFEAEIQKIFRLLQRERTLMLGMRSARIVTDCIAAIAEARTTAEALFRERIERLDAQRIPNPDDFCRRQMARIEPAIQTAARDVIYSARSFAYRGVESLFLSYRERIENALTLEELEAVEREIQGSFNDAIADIVLESRRWARKELGAAATLLEDTLLEDLKACYRIVEKLARVSGMAIKKSGGWVSFDPPSITPYAAPQKSFFAGIVRRLGAWLKGMGEYHTEAIGTVRTYLDLAQSDMQSKLSVQQGAMADALRRALGDSIQSAVEAFQSWIAAVIDDERMTVDAERAKLQRLVQLGENLTASETALDEAMRAAEKDSIGISR